MLFLGIDVCFKLKLKDRGFKDPDLGTRLAYMVNNTEYVNYISTCAAAGGSNREVSSCKEVSSRFVLLTAHLSMIRLQLVDQSCMWSIRHTQRILRAMLQPALQPSPVIILLSAQLVL